MKLIRFEGGKWLHLRCGLSFFFIHFLCLFMMTSCDNTPTYAPVMDVSNIEPIPKSGVHRVLPGETIYEIAWRYGLDYRSLAVMNHLKSPYLLHNAQLIALHYQQPAPLSNRKMQKPMIVKIEKITVSQRTAIKEQHSVVKKWIWPAKGKITNSFTRLNKGINITGQLGDDIYATAAGKVVYSGDGLRGYGNLIILKHNSQYLSAYAHNRVIFVKEGEWVRQGQKIAEMGSTGSDKIMLHFEIRRAGKPIDPITLLGTL